MMLLTGDCATVPATTSQQARVKTSVVTGCNGVRNCELEPRFRER